MLLNGVIAAVFGAAALACFAGAYRGSRLRRRDARLGLRVLLVTVGVWAGLQAIQMLVTDRGLAVALFTAGLIVGFGTVWAWLYFCSAYTGRDYHRRRPYQAAAIAVYVVLLVVKLTNPIHGQYFTATMVSEPYIRLVITQQPLYWLSFMLAYGLVAIGLYFLLETFRRSPQSTRTLSALVIVTALSIVPKVISGVYPTVIPELSYEPLGVAVFALGALYLVEDTFHSLETPTRRQLFEEADEGVITLGPDDRIQEYNRRALELFPALESELQTRDDLLARLPIDQLAERTHLVEIDREGEQRSYLLSEQPLSIGPHRLGRTVFVQDITDARRRQRELERHDQHLDAMAGAIAHELRNAVGITRGYLDMAATDLETAEDAPASAQEAVGVAQETTARMERVIDDLHALTRYAKTVDEYDAIAFRAAAERAYRSLDIAPELVIEGEGELLATPERLDQLFTNAFRFADYAGADTVRVTLTDDGFTIADDGAYAGPDYGEALFGYEEAAPTSEAGLLLPNVQTLARVHGWEVQLDSSYTAGVRYRVTGVTVEHTEATA